MTGRKYDPALAKTRRMPAIKDKSTGSPRVCLRVPADELRRWEALAKRLHLPSMTAIILQVMGEKCDRLGIR